MPTSYITSSKYPIGLILPITNGSAGYFQQSFDTNTQVKNNLYNFLKTRQGERRMNPAFGTKLYTVLFEQRDENTKEIIKNLITEELTQWVPEVSVLEISVSDVENHENGDNYKMRINLKFKIKSTNKTDNFEFELENVRI